MITASVTGSPRKSSASFFNCRSTIELMVWGLYSVPSMRILQSVPICLFTELMVRSGFVAACRFAVSPTNLSPFFAKATTLGVVLAPELLGTMTGCPFSTTDTQLFVVPRSIPITLLIIIPPSQNSLLKPALLFHNSFLVNNIRVHSIATFSSFYQFYENFILIRFI